MLLRARRRGRAMLLRCRQQRAGACWSGTHADGRKRQQAAARQRHFRKRLCLLPPTASCQWFQTTGVEARCTAGGGTIPGENLSQILSCFFSLRAPAFFRLCYVPGGKRTGVGQSRIGEEIHVSGYLDQSHTTRQAQPSSVPTVGPVAAAIRCGLGSRAGADTSASGCSLGRRAYAPTPSPSSSSRHMKAQKQPHIDSEHRNTYHLRNRSARSAVVRRRAMWGEPGE